MKKRTWLSWSSGKDSAWALHVLRDRPDIQAEGLFCTVNQEFDRVAMHGVRLELLQRQAEGVGLPLQIIPIPHPCTNADYESVMEAFTDKARQRGITCFAFGDLFLEDVRRYRETRLAGTGIEPLFPIWGIPTKELAAEMIDNGLRARITCIDPVALTPTFAGREYDRAFLDRLPAGVDPCGERGEFHSFAFDGPMFEKPVSVQAGETVERDGFVFCDLIAGAPAP